MSHLKKALLQAHGFAEEIVREGDRVVDATMGNGNDTLFLARLVGPLGQVYAFDIQQAAFDRTHQRLAEAGVLERCQLVLEGHQHMDRYVEGPIKLVLFNLGYLPSGDHAIGTRAHTTIEAVEKSLSLISDDGLVIIVIYHGGDSGFEERDALLDHLNRLNCRQYSVMKSEFINQINCPPILIAIEKNLPSS